MVREPFRELSDHRAEPVPEMFRRPSDVSEPLPHIRGGERVATLHKEWLRITTPLVGQEGTPWQRFIRPVRRIATGGARSFDLIGDLIRAVDSVAARCDELSDRLAHQQVVLDDAVTIFGEELTRLRAEAARTAGGEHKTARPAIDDE